MTPQLTVLSISAFVFVVGILIVLAPRFDNKRDLVDVVKGTDDGTQPTERRKRYSLVVGSIVTMIGMIGAFVSLFIHC